jgi:hypothetical protein
MMSASPAFTLTDAYSPCPLAMVVPIVTLNAGTKVAPLRNPEGCALGVTVTDAAGTVAAGVTAADVVADLEIVGESDAVLLGGNGDAVGVYEGSGCEGLADAVADGDGLPEVVSDGYGLGVLEAVALGDGDVVALGVGVTLQSLIILLFNNPSKQVHLIMLHTRQPMSQCCHKHAKGSGTLSSQKSQLL